ncbi:hypothetical protein PG999_005148 [Apiospora kogelbergensis]|uniref:Uncharacterized protein n=1 Tax=Apiospora kogelbergensis TaxID=1337665 RepID=A0AAW0R1H8_9PEZI
MEFFKSFGRKRQSKAVTPLAAAATTTAVVVDTGQHPKAKSDESLPPQQQGRRNQQQQVNGSSTSISITGPAFRQVRWGESTSSPTSSNPVSLPETAGGCGEERSPSDKGRQGPITATANSNSPARLDDCKIRITRSSSLESLTQQHHHFYSPIGDTDYGEPSPLFLTTPEKDHYIATSLSDHEDQLEPLPSPRPLVESFAIDVRTHSQKPSLGRRGAIYVSPKRQRHEKSLSLLVGGSAKEEHRGRILDDINGSRSVPASRDPSPPKSAFLGNNIKRWEALLAQQTAALEEVQATVSSMMGRQVQQGGEEEEQGIIDNGEPSGIGNQANEEAVEAVRRLGRGEFQAVFTDFERAHTRSATQQIQRQRTKSPDAIASAEQTNESVTSRHRSRSI